MSKTKSVPGAGWERPAAGGRRARLGPRAPSGQSISPPSPEQRLAEAFLDALEERDFDRAGSYLHDDGFSYVGPTRRFDRADRCMEDLSRIGQILQRLERRKTFVDGEDVCVIFDFLSTLPGLDRVRIASWFRVERGKIASIEMFFDAHPYALMFEPGDAYG